jgi:nucleoside-diphosphate-sugar epimerase
VYGPGSWFDQFVLSRLANRQPILYIANCPHKISPIHVEDCAKALLHVLAHGEVGKRYFLVDDRPITLRELCALAARELGVPHRAITLPRLLSRLFLGSITTELLTIDQCLSNQRLRALGFEFMFPTIREGVPAAVASWKAQRAKSTTISQ